MDRRLPPLVVARMLLPRRTLFAAVCTLGVLTAPLAHADTTHVVAPGHTLAKIARRYHISVEALRDANNLHAGERLRPGQRLVIPDGDAPPAEQPRPSKPAAPAKPAAASPETTHRVAPGQTLARIAQRYRTSVDAILDANGLTRAPHLKPGACIVVPLPPDARPVPQRERPCSPNAENRPGATKTFASRPPQPGVLHIVRGTVAWRGRLVDRRGRALPDARKHIERLMMSDATGETHPTDLRLLPILTQVSDHFGGRTLHIVSGFRPPTANRYTAHSHHNNGEAVDFYVEGVPNDVLRDYLHTFSRVGVGYYPNSTFVHLDVRSVTTHWVDESGPGEAPVYSSVVAPDAPPRAYPPTQPRLATPRPVPDPDTEPDSE
jgi:LysM repeat protein